MSRLHRFSVILFIFMLAACSQPAAAPTVGQVKDFATACDKANNGQRIAVTGYLRFPDSFTASDSVVLRLYEKDDYAGQPIGVQINFGDQPNQVATVGDNFTDKDLNVHLASGQVAGYGTPVKVSGKVYYPLASQDFPCALENPLVEAVP
jgi:hypothetical protein